MLFHYLAGTLNRARYTRFTHKHVMRFFGEHKAARTRQRVKA